MMNEATIKGLLWSAFLSGYAAARDAGVEASPQDADEQFKEFLESIKDALK